MRQKLPATPTISVIVATRNRRAALEQFLNHIRRLPSTPGWELIIVDNGSSDDTSTLLASAGDALPLLAIEEPRQGKSRALNKALSYARGDLILFADDDIVPDQWWLSALSAAAGFPAQARTASTSRTGVLGALAHVHLLVPSMSGSFRRSRLAKQPVLSLPS